jgi:hypothetical protein
MMFSKPFIALVFLALTSSVNANAAIAGLARQACGPPVASPLLGPISERSEPTARAAYNEKRMRKHPFLGIVIRDGHC